MLLNRIFLLFRFSTKILLKCIPLWWLYTFVFCFWTAIAQTIFCNRYNKVYVCGKKNLLSRKVCVRSIENIVYRGVGYVNDDWKHPVEVFQELFTAASSCNKITRARIFQMKTYTRTVLNRSIVWHFTQRNEEN